MIGTVITLMCGGLLIVGRTVPAAVVTQNPVWPRPVIVPVPDATSGVAQTVTLLNDWKTTANPQGVFWSGTNNYSGWRTMQVGGGRGGFGGGGFGVSGSGQSAFETSVNIPADYAGHRVMLRFEGVSNSAKVWVNGKFVRDHWGSLMPFTCDITDFVEPGKAANLVLGVDDSRVGLAKYVRAGGIQRDVKLFAGPVNYISRLHIGTDLDSRYRDATLKVWLGMKFNAGNEERVKLSLKNAKGLAMVLKPDTIDLSQETPETITDIPVANPLKWDAEHPNLYTLQVSVTGSDGSVLETLSKKFGFEKIERAGREVLVNGKQIKLRGLWGGNSVQDMVDININHTRQKWVTEDFLNDSDRIGVYVTDENPVDFAKNPVAGDPKFHDQYVSFMADLVERDRDHPSVIMWGLDNESDYGANVAATYDYVHAEDPQRLTQFSWGSHVPADKPLPYDAYSFHYPPFDGDLASYGNAAFNANSLVLDRKPQPVIPVIADEYAHLPIYDPDELRRDPNVHNFWGESIKRYWEKMFLTDGALGGDIFGLRGGRGALPPEYWLIKKAYSPVRVDDQTLSNPGAGQPLKILVKNWYDHTNLDELKVYWSVGKDSGDVAGPDVAPHADGHFEIPARDWQDGDVVSLRFQRGDGLVVQESALPVSPKMPELPKQQGPAPQVTEDANRITVAGQEFSLVFSKQTGLITSGSFGGSEIIKSGPYFHIVATDRGKSTLDLPQWTLKQIAATRENEQIVILISGSYGGVGVDYKLHVDGLGLMTLHYKLGAFSFKPPAAHANPWNDSHYGGFSEVGISFVLTNNVDRLAWNRKALWSFYPEDHIGRGVGVAQRAAASGSWGQSSGGGRGGRGGYGGGFGGGVQAETAGSVSNDFRAMKEYIYSAAALVSGTDLGLEALSDAHDGVRMDASGVSKQGGVDMIVNNEWNYPQLGNSNYMKPPIIVGEGYQNTVRMRFTRDASIPSSPPLASK
jgi:hypothetical protein